MKETLARTVEPTRSHPSLTRSLAGALVLGALLAIAPRGAAASRVETTSSDTVRVLNVRVVHGKQATLVTGTAQPGFGTAELTGHHLHIEVTDPDGRKLQEQDVLLTAGNAGTVRRIKSAAVPFTARFEPVLPPKAQVHVTAH